MADEKPIYLVNPSGAIHVVTREHARQRLATVGWRIATRDEIKELKAREANAREARAKGERAHATQAFDAPIATPWSPEPPEAPDLDAEEEEEDSNGGGESVSASDAAAALAAEKGIDLAEIKGSGKGGNITKGDVEAAIEASEE